MSVAKRFFVFLLAEVVLCIIMAVFIIIWLIRESPAVVQKVDLATADITAHFTAIGYEKDFYKGWKRNDPLGNFNSKMSLGFYNFGELEWIYCEAGYMNTELASVIYADMEATMQAMGGSLTTYKDDVMQVVNKIRNDQFANTSGKGDNIKWSIESNTYDNGSGGKIRYACFKARAYFLENESALQSGK